MPSTDTLAIVGGGLAAAKAVEALRTHGHTGRVVLLGAEPHLPYERPPLSKGYLLGNDPLESAFVHPREWYDDHDVELMLGAPVTGIDPAAHTLECGQERIAYDRVLIATGCVPRRLPPAEHLGPRVTSLRTMEDSQRIRAELEPGKRIAIIGGGWIGLEVAAAARTAGCEVVVVETLDLPLLRVLGPEVAQVFADLHRAHGVDLRTGAEVYGITREAEHVVVQLGRSTVEADLLVVGIGVTPDVALAEAAGLAVDNGIIVDETLRASLPDVFAAGDVANAYHPTLGRHLRVEHWDNAIAQGETAAQNMLGGDVSHTRLPYFFTDQYDLGMEYVGHVAPGEYDEVVLRGDVPGLVFTALWLRGDRVLAGMHVGDWDAIDTLRALVAAPRVDAAAARDPGVPLGDLVP